MLKDSKESFQPGADTNSGGVTNGDLRYAHYLN